jgi:hypothetical protein
VYEESLVSAMAEDVGKREQSSKTKEKGRDQLLYTPSSIDLNCRRGDIRNKHLPTSYLRHKPYQPLLANTSRTTTSLSSLFA